MCWNLTDKVIKYNFKKYYISFSAISKRFKGTNNTAGWGEETWQRHWFNVS